MYYTVYNTFIIDLVYLYMYQFIIYTQLLIRQTLHNLQQEQYTGVGWPKNYYFIK